MRYITIIAVILFSLSAKAISVPVTELITSGNIISKNISAPGADSSSWLLNLRAGEIAKLTGRKLSLREKIAFAFIKYKLKRQANRTAGNKIHDDGQTAFILGLTGAIALLIPILDLASIPLAILAIVIGNKAKRADPHDRKARIGVTLGVITLGALIVIAFAVAIVLTIGQFPR